MPDEEELKAWVVEKISNGMSMRDVILHVCEAGQMSWPQAEQFVQNVQVYRSPQINQRRLIVVAIASTTILVPGLLQMGQGIWQILASTSDHMSNVQMVGSMAGLMALSYQYLLPGITMCIGGTIGLFWAYRHYKEQA
jgi:uncharacterized membrane protein